MNHPFTILVLAGAVLLLQGHAMAFWAHWLGWPGLGWSLLLEAVALWLWWQPRRRALGFVASVLLIIGPLYHVSAPVLAGGRTSEANAEVLATLRAEVTQREQALAIFLQNSTARPGWLAAIQEAQDGLDAARAALRHAATESAQAATPWQRLAVMTMQLVALVLFQAVAVMATTTLADSHAPPAKQSREARGSGPTEPIPTAVPASPSASLAARTIARLDEVLRETGLSQNAWGKLHGFSSKQMSQVRNHDRVVAAGVRGAPSKLIERMAQALGLPLKEEA